METFTDYYALLGVDAHASNDTIKAAFKKLALKYHPDVYKGEDAPERMRLLLVAYQTLSDTDERRIYNTQHAELLGLVLNGADSVRQPASTSAGASPRRGSSDKKFAFPDLDNTGGSASEFSLDGYAYKLSSDDALILKHYGILRGVAPDAAQGSAHYCHRCHHHWTAPAPVGQNMVCPKCKSKDWAEFLLLRCVHCHAVFESREIRDKMLGGRLFFPYELFPLCPNCRRSQWCPAEDVRLNALRAAEARRRAILLTSVMVVTVLVVGALLFLLAR